MICNCEHNNAYADNLRLVRGNDFATVHDIVAKYPDDTEVEGFDLNVCTDLGVRIKRDSSSFKDIETYAETWSIIEPKKIKIKFDGLKMKNGSYRIEFFGKFQGKDWRCYSDEKGFGVVESNEEANIPAETIIADGVYLIGTDFTMTYQTQEQADWEETDDTLPSYIKNKPDLSIYVEKVEGKDLSDNNYSDEEKQKVEDAVPNTREINGKALDSDITLTSSDIGALPTSTKYGYSIDLTLNSQDYKLTASLKDQDGTLLNSKVVDFPLETVVVSGRYDSTNRAIVLTLQNGNAISVPIGDLVNGLQTQITSSNKLASDLVDDTNSVNKFVTASDKSSWNGKQDALVSGVNIKTINNESLLGSGNIHISGGGGGGAIDSISVNGTPQTIDENKNVDITVPTKVSDLDNDSGFITGYTETDPIFVASAAHGISSSDISNWNSKGTYSKPSGGIPSTDMTEAVQTSLGKADTALQSFTETDPIFTASDAYGISSSDISNWNSKGTYSKPSGGIPASDLASGVIPTVPTISTDISSDAASDTKTASPKAVKTYADSVAGDTNVIEGIKMNNTSLSPDANKVVDLGTVITSHQDISGKENTSNKVTSLSSSSTDTQYPSAKCVYDLVGDIETLLAAI